MKQFISFVVSGIMIAGFGSCSKIVGHGPVVSEMRTATNFTAINSRISGDVYYKQDSVYRLEVRGQRNLLDLLETNVSNGELVIHFRNNLNIWNNDDIDVIVSAPAVSSFSISGSGNLETEGNITAASSRFAVSGSGDIRVAKITASGLEASVSGSGDIRMSQGTVMNETLKITGSGSLNMLNVSAKTAETNTTGSGTTRLSVSDQLNTRITGSGNVYYQGRPVVNAKVTGSGRVSGL